MYWEMVPNIQLDKFRDFFRFYKGTPNQDEALEILWAAMPVSLLEPDTAWVLKYREPEPKTESEIPAAAIDLICEFEGFRENVYDDGVGVPTIGYGSTFYENNDRVAWGDPPIPVFAIEIIVLSLETITQPTEGFAPVIPLFLLATLIARFIKKLSFFIICMLFIS